MSSAFPHPLDASEGAAPRRPGSGRALVPVPAPAASRFAARPGLVAAGVAVVMGLGFVAGTAAFASKGHVAAPPDATAEALGRVQGEVRALKASLDGLHNGAEDRAQADTIRGLKRSVEALRQDLDGAKAASAGAVGQLGAKLDRLDRDPGPKLAEIAARLDKIDPDAKLAQVTARLDRVEREVASADTTGAIPPVPAAAPQRVPPHPATAPSAPAVPPAPVAARPEAANTAPRPAAVPRPDESRPAPLGGWLLRDVYGGVALVEGRRGGLREVAPGEYVPGVGEIRSIERRGRGWVVVTSRGLIVADGRW